MSDQSLAMDNALHDHQPGKGSASVAKTTGNGGETQQLIGHDGWHKDTLTLGAALHWDREPKVRGLP